MTNRENIRLCGGTFFTLLLEDRKPRAGVREHYSGEKDGLSEPEVLIGLSKVLVPDFQEPLESMMTTIKGNTSEYKSCKNKGGTYFPFGNKVALTAFDKCIKENYQVALNRMIEFCDEFLHVKDSTKKDERLVKALIDTIDKDDSIESNQLFYALQDGTGMSKADIVKSQSFCFQTFLLGILHFCVMRTDPATIGKETFDFWCPPKNRAPRTYVGTMGEDWKKEVKLTYAEEIGAERKDPEIVEIIEADQEQTYEEQQSDVEGQGTKEAPQMNFTFNVTGNNNSFYNHVDTVNNYYGGKKDGK